MNRRCTVLGTDAKGSLVLQAADYGTGTAPVPRPIVGSSTTGLHTSPPVGAQVLVLHDGEHMTPIPAAAVSASDALGTLPSLLPAETAIYGSDGRAISYVKADGTTTLWSKSGKPSTTVDANGNISVGGALTMAGNTTATSATGGSATALPAQPAAYLLLTIGSTSYKLPVYNP